MSISLERVAEKYLVAKKLSEGTRKEYRSTVTKWLSWGHGVDVDQIERHHIRDFLDWVRLCKKLAEVSPPPGDLCNLASSASLFGWSSFAQFEILGICSGRATAARAYFRFLQGS